MATEELSYYKNKVASGESFPDVIKQCREDYSCKEDFSHNVVYRGMDVPFNLEREYLIALIEQKRYTDAKAFIENMRLVYRTPNQFNFIEVYEYHLNAVFHSENNIKDSIREAKKEFNTHTITLTGIIVGVVTILGAGNQSLRGSSFQDGMNIFIAIVLAVVFLIVGAFAANSGFRR